MKLQRFSSLHLFDECVDSATRDLDVLHWEMAPICMDKCDMSKLILTKSTHIYYGLNKNQLKAISFM